MKDISVLRKLYDVIEDRKSNPVKESYTSYLFEKGIDKILKKVGEENTEIIIAAKNNTKEEVVEEVCDYIYHLMVLLVEEKINLSDIEKELEIRREKIGNKKPERKEINNI